jgi:hypothetical protein
LAGPCSVFETGVDRSGAIPSPHYRAGVDAERGVDFVMSEADQDRVSAIDLEGTLSDIADDVDDIWTTP